MTKLTLFLLAAITLLILTQNALAQVQTELDFLSALSNTDISLKEKAVFYNQMGWLVRCKRDFPKGMEYYSTAIELQKEANNPLGAVRSLNGIGNVYANQANYNQVLKFYFEALKKDEEQKNKQIWLVNTVKSLLSTSNKESIPNRL